MRICGSASAQTTFTWSSPTGGDWGTDGNWLFGAFPNASGTTADFSTLTIQYPGVVNLGASYTVGNLVFGDHADENGWTLTSNVAADTLTMKVASGSPTITINNQYVYITAVLAGNQGLTLSGVGNIYLAPGEPTSNGVNTYTGITAIDTGTILDAVDGYGLPTENNLQLTGGILESNGTFTRTLGVNTKQVQWVGSSGGGFSAQGSEFDIELDNSTNAVTWNTGGLPATGVPMLFNDLTSDSLLNFKNGISLANAAQTFEVTHNPNSTTDLAEISGVLTNGGVTLTGTGVLWLNAANTYTKPTLIQGGILRATVGSTLPALSNLTLDGGVFESNGTFMRTLGTAAGDVQWTGSGGFSAQGGEFDIRLNNSANAVTWGSGSFVPTGQQLILNAYSSDSLLNFENAINLAGALQTVDAVNNPNLTTDLAELSGILSNGGLIVNGSGVLLLTATNTYTLQTELEGGTLRANDGTTLPTKSNLTFNGGVFESHGTFTRALGTAADQVQWTGAGGFSAKGGEFDIKLGNSTAVVTFGVGSFVPSGDTLILNAATADSLLNFENAINLDDGYQTVASFDNPNSTTDLAEISGIMTNGGFVKDGTGTLWLSGKNTYALSTFIEAGTLRAIDGTGLPTGSDLVLDGGMFESNGTFKRLLGTTGGEVDWQASGGFSAQGGPLTIELNGNTSTVTWGSTYFVPSGEPLVFNVADLGQRGELREWNQFGGDEPNRHRDRQSQLGRRLRRNQRRHHRRRPDQERRRHALARSEEHLHAADRHRERSIAGPRRNRSAGGQQPAFSTAAFLNPSALSPALGTGTANNQVQWQGSGGFSAQGGQFNIKLGGGTATVTWGIAEFVPNGFSLLFNSVTSDSLVNFENGINLGGFLQTVYVTDNTFLTTDLAQISGVITNGGLIKAGAGTLILSATNTYAGGTQIAAGTLEITSNAALGATTASPNITFTGNAASSGSSSSSGGGGIGGGISSGGGGSAPASDAGTLQFATSFTGTFSASRVIEVEPGISGTIDTNGLSITGAGQLLLLDTVAGTGFGTGSSTLIKADSTGAGVFESDVAPYLGNGSSLQVNSGTLRFKTTSIPNTAFVGTGVTATVASGATLELAGTTSALGILGGNVTNIVNNSQAATTGGLYVSGTNQVLGTITGTGNTVVGTAALPPA